MIMLAVMSSCLYIAHLDHPLLEPEEARYAEIPRQMLVEGRWWTPVLHGEEYWQKPPLLYWLIMISYQVFGVHDWSARLIPCLSALLTIALTTGWAWRVLGFWAGLVSGTMLALSARFLYLAGMLTMDGLLCTCVMAGLAFGHLAQNEPQQHRRWLLLSAFACAMGILAKGPVALVLIAVPLLMHALLDRRSIGWSIRDGLLYLSVVAVVAGPWYLVMACLAPGQAGTFFWLHHLVRYFAPFDHEKPTWFYVPSLLLGMWPWSLLLPSVASGMFHSSPRAARRRPAPLGLFVLAFVWCILFFSLSGCKRQGYILPAFPLLALVLGTYLTHGLPWRRWMQGASVPSTLLQRGGQRWPRWLLLATLAMGMTLGAAAALSRLCTWMTILAILGGLAFLATGVIFESYRRPVWCSWAGCVLGVFGLLFLGQRTWMPAYHAQFGLRQQVELGSAYEQEEALPMISYPKRWDSISFYTQRNDIISYRPLEIDQLTRALQAHRKAVLFIRRDISVQTLLQALPADLEIDWQPGSHHPVTVGLVRPQHP